MRTATRPLANGATPQSRYPPTGRTACFERPYTSAIGTCLLSFVVRRRRQWCTHMCVTTAVSSLLKPRLLVWRNPGELQGSLKGGTKPLLAPVSCRTCGTRILPSLPVLFVGRCLLVVCWLCLLLCLFVVPGGASSIIIIAVFCGFCQEGGRKK